MTRIKRHFVFIGTVICFLLISCGGKDNSDQSPIIKKLPILTVQLSNANVDTDYPARIKGRVVVDIRSQADGYIEKIFVDEGDYVKAGQPLFKIIDRS